MAFDIVDFNPLILKLFHYVLPSLSIILIFKFGKIKNKIICGRSGYE